MKGELALSAKSLCLSVRAAVIAVAMCGIVLCVFVLPFRGAQIADFGAAGNLAWLWFLWISSIPCYAILVLVWLVSGAIKLEQAFTPLVAKWIKYASLLLLADAVFFFAGNIALALMGMHRPVLLMIAMIVDIFAISLAFLSAVISRFIMKAAILQDESEGTI